MFVILYSFWNLMVIHCSLSALIENKIFSVHGGLSPAISTLDQVWASILAFIITIVTFNFWSPSLYVIFRQPLLFGRYEQLTVSKKYLMMVLCVTYYGQILKILWMVGVWAHVVLVSCSVAVLFLHLTMQTTLTIYVVPISWWWKGINGCSIIRLLLYGRPQITVTGINNIYI